MIKRLCDSCNKEIIGNYWTIDIYQHTDRSGRVSIKGAENNFKNFADKMCNREKEYCEKCINQIKEKIESVFK